LKNNTISGENITLHNDINVISKGRSNKEICFWIFIGVCIWIILLLVTFLALTKFHESIQNTVNSSLRNEILILQNEQRFLKQLLETQFEKNAISDSCYKMQLEKHNNN